MADYPALSRADLLAGRVRFDRRPARVLAAIEARCAYMARESRRALEAYFLRADGEFQREFNLDYFQAFKLRADAGERLGLADLEHYACRWQSLVPPDPAVRAAVARLLCLQYGIEDGLGPGVAEALDIRDPDVQSAYERLYGEALAANAPAEQAPPSRELIHRTTRRVDENTLREAESALEWVDLPGGSALYRAGDPGDALYILVSGRLREFMPGEDGIDRLTAERGRGDLVGESEVLTGDRRAATVYAARDSELVKLPQAALERLAEKHPQVMLRVNRMLAARLRARLAEPERKATNFVTFALIPAGPGVPLADFARRLTSALSVYGPVFHVDRARVEEALGPGAAQTPRDDADNDRVAGWLSEQEVQYRYVVYQADAKASPWTDRCLRQADCILILANAANEPQVGEAEGRIAELGAEERSELLLLHSDDVARPSGTRRWLDRRRIARHHHLHANSERDLERLARHLTGHALGVVFGGGGARGWAHVGAWRAMRESGMHVDLIGGTSMGALLGALFAMGLSDQEIRQLAGRHAPLRRWVDPTLPALSMLASEKAVRILQQLYGDWQIEDLWQPFFCVASDLTDATQKVFTEGPLWLAVRASTAIPGIFSPVMVEGRLLVDGGVLNNLPIDIMREQSEGGTIVAVNVFPDVDLDQNYQFGPSVSGFDVLFSWLNPLAQSMPVPSIFENLVRVMALNDVHQAKAKRNLADIYIRPPVERFNILDFGAYRAIMDIGYRSACDEIALWRQAQAGVLRDPALVQPVERLQHALADLEDMLEGLSGGQR